MNDDAPSERGERKTRAPQSPSVLPEALEAVRCAAGFAGWETVSNAIDMHEKRHPEFDVGTSADVYLDIIKNRGKKMFYGQLEALAGVTGVPSGVILDVSHAMSLLRSGRQVDEARKYAEGLRALANAIEAEATPRAAIDLATQRELMTGFFRVWKARGLNVAMPLKKISAQRDPGKRRK